MKYILTILLVIITGLLLGSNSFDGKTIVHLPNLEMQPSLGQNVMFVTASGGGDCSGWDDACTFKVAVSKCTSALQDVIYLSPEDHDTGSDATGVDISAYNVRIIGAGMEHNFASKIYNTAASVTHVLKMSGHRVTVENVRFTQMSQIDVDATLLHISGNRCGVKLCHFRSGAGAASDIAILIDGGADYTFLQHIHAEDFTDAVVRTNDVQFLEAYSLIIRTSTTGIDLTNAVDEDFIFGNCEIYGCTTGIAAAAGVNRVQFDSPRLLHNTTNVSDSADYDGLEFFNAVVAHGDEVTYPANAGVTVAGHADPWGQGTLTEIIPASTISSPFVITKINIQSCTAANIFKLELLYGEATGDHSLGIIEFVSTNQIKHANVSLAVGSLPSNSYIGVRLASSTGGADEVVITASYQKL